MRTKVTEINTELSKHQSELEKLGSKVVVIDEKNSFAHKKA